MNGLKELRRGGKRTLKLTDEAREKLMKLQWPGNVRELWNVVNRVLLTDPQETCEASAIVFDESLIAEPSVSSGGEEVQREGPSRGLAGVVEVKGKTLSQIEASYLAIVMEAAQGSRTLACRQLGIDNKRLLRMLKEYGLEQVGRDDDGNEG